MNSLWAFRPPVCNPNTLVLHKAKGSIWRRCPALGDIQWQIWNFVSNHLSLFLLVLWKRLQLIWPRVPLKKFTPLLPHLPKTLYLINHSLHVFYVDGCCDVSSRSLFWTEALSPLAARSAGLSQLVASLFGSFGLKGAVHSPKVTLSPACKGAGEQFCIQWLVSADRGAKACTTCVHLEQLWRSTPGQELITGLASPPPPPWEVLYVRAGARRCCYRIVPNRG